MKTNLKKVLNTLDRVDFMELRHTLDFAEMTRNIKIKYELDDERMAKELEVTDKELETMYSGTYRWDVIIWSKLEALQERMDEEKRIDERLKKY